MGIKAHWRATLAFYWALYVAALKARAEYRVDFLVAVVTPLIMQLSALSFYWVLFEHAPSLGGWPPHGVMFLFAMSALVLGLSELFLNGIWSLPWYVVGGDLDRLLLYPVRPLSFLLVARPELHALGNLASGILLLWSCWVEAALPAWALFLVPLWAASGALIYSAALVLMSGLLFYMVGHSTQQFNFVYHLLLATRYPANIYPRWLQLLLLAVFPVALATFVPGQWLFGKSSLWVAALSPPIVAAAATWIAHRTWGIALGAYESTGS
jgi:viologen exporter family transport system permease protein